MLPVAFCLLLGWAFNGDAGPTQQRVDLLDLDKSELTTTLIDALHQANPTLLLCPMDNNAGDDCGLKDTTLDEAQAIERARSGQTQALLILPQGYTQAVMKGTAVQIEFYSTSNPDLPSPVQRTVEAVLQRVNSASLATGVAGAMLEAVAPADRAPFFSTALRQQFVADVFTKTTTALAAEPPVIRYISTKAEPDMRQQNGFNQSVPGMGAMYTMFTVLAGMAVLWRERRQWTLQRLVVLPISKAQLVAGKITTYFVLGMIQYLIVFIVGYFVGVDFGNNPLALLLIVVAFVLCITALTFAIAPHISSEGQANGMARLLGLSLAPLGGAWWPLEIVPPFMRIIGHISPVAWAMDGFHKLIFDQAGLAAVFPEIGVLLGAAMLLFLIAVRTFKYE